MANKKKNLKLVTRGFGTKRLLPELQKAAGLMQRKKFAEARQLLIELNQLYPHNVDVLVPLVNACLEMHDLPGYTDACEQFLQAAPHDPDSADAAYGLAGGYLATRHPFLALSAFQYALAHFPRHSKAQEATQLVSQLSEEMEKTLAEMKLTGESGREIALLHERAQAELERGKYEQARSLEEEVLRRRPDFMSALNNLSLISFAAGQLAEAIAASERVLTIEPENVHALSNLVRYSILQGHHDLAQQYADRLQASQAKSWDVWAKKAEGLSFVGDTAGVLSLYEQAKAADDLEIASPLFHHLVAVALARSGQTKQARQQWQKVLQRSPGDELAQGNLNDLNRPVSEQHGAWAFTFNHWLLSQDLADLRAMMQTFVKSKAEGQLSKTVQQYTEKHPQFVPLIAVLLERGDPAGREFAFRTAMALGTPEMLSVLRDFALGQWGPDQMRHEAVIKASKAGLFESEMVWMWLKGEWRELKLIAYEFHDKDPYNHSKQVTQLLIEVIKLLRQGDRVSGATAERLLQSALKLEPDQPDLLNNLAVSYQIQGRFDEMRALLQQITEQFPDYVLAPVSLARLRLQAGEVDAAAEMLKPILARKRFHIDDFAFLSNVYIELLLAQKQKKAAKTWLQMWEGIDPENQTLLFWKAKLMGPDLMDKLAGLTSQRKS